MDLADLDPALRTPVISHLKLPLTSPAVLRAAQAASRLIPASPLPRGVARHVVDAAGGRRVRVFVPAGGGNGSALLWIHGGGYIIGAAAQDDARCAGIADRLDAVVADVEYRLSPGCPFPGPLDDCFAAWRWLLWHASQGRADAGRLAIGGQSAGGGLAAALAQRIHDAGGPQPAAQWLFCPMLDDRTAADRSLDGVDHFIWNNTANRVGWRSYLGCEPGAAEVPADAVASRREDLSGLPPAWLGYGTVELFCDEDRSYARRLREAGVDTTVDEVPGAPHAFESMAAGAPVARAYVGRAEEWLRDRLDG